MIALTGATGFLGYHVVKALQTKGLEFSCLVRESSSRLLNLKSLTPNTRVVNFAQSASIQAALEGIDVLIHMMGLINGTDELLQTVNIHYTQNILEAAKRARVRKIVFISSVAAQRRHGSYGETKFQAEEKLRQSVIPYTILRPAYIYGNGDLNNTSLMIKTLKRFPIVPLLGGGDFKLQPVYVEDVVSLILQSIHKPALNREFNVAGPAQISLREILKELSLGLQVQRSFLPIPLKPVQAILRIYLSLFPKTKLPAKQILELDKHEAFDIAETSREFHFQPIPFSLGRKKMFEELLCAE